MKIDRERILKYLSEIKSRHHDLEELLRANSDTQMLDQPWVLKGMKYSLIEIAEAMAATLQHILAKDLGEAVTGYVETIAKSGEKKIVPQELAGKLNPFFRFRNSLVHRYWFISDEKLLALVRENKDDFLAFIESIESYLKSRPAKP